MAKVIFYEKPGCANNARQKTLLATSGHELDVRNIGFFGDACAPRVCGLHFFMRSKAPMGTMQP